MSTENAIYATLVRGRVYFLGAKEFLFQEEQEVTEAERDWLEVHAIDEVTVEGENEHQQRKKFKFEVRPRGDAPSAKTPSPRSRSR